MLVSMDYEFKMMEGVTTASYSGVFILKNFTFLYLDNKKKPLAAQTLQIKDWEGTKEQEELVLRKFEEFKKQPRTNTIITDCF